MLIKASKPKTNKFQISFHRLPLPSALNSMFPASEDQLDNPEEHDGRIRSFAHERGNWATYVYIPCWYYITVMISGPTQ
jgi:hypothetical protein